MKAAARPEFDQSRRELAQALAELEIDIGTGVRRILSLATVAVRASKVEPLDAGHLLDVLDVIAQQADMADNDLSCAVDVARRAAGLEGGAPCR